MPGGAMPKTFHMHSMPRHAIGNIHNAMPQHPAWHFPAENIMTWASGIAYRAMPYHLFAMT